MLLLAGMSSAVAWAMMPHPLWVEMGATSQLRTDGPTLERITLDASGSLAIWIVPTQQGWLALDGDSRPQPSCRIRWLPIAQQFWDVCSRLTLIWNSTGELLSYPAVSQADLSPFLRDLDRYPTTVESGIILVEPYQRISGMPRASPPANAVCKDFFDMVIDWLRCTVPN